MQHKNRAYRRMQAKRLFVKRKKMLKIVFGTEHCKYRSGDSETMKEKRDGMLRKKLNYTSSRYDNPNVMRKNKIDFEKTKYELEELSTKE